MSVKGSQGFEECETCVYRESPVCGECEEADQYEEDDGGEDDALEQVVHLLAA